MPVPGPSCRRKRKLYVEGNHREETTHLRSKSVVCVKFPSLLGPSGNYGLSLSQKMPVPSNVTYKRWDVNEIVKKNVLSISNAQTYFFIFYYEVSQSYVCKTRTYV